MWVNGFLVALFITTGVCKTVLHLPARDAYDTDGVYWGIFGVWKGYTAGRVGSSTARRAECEMLIELAARQIRMQFPMGTISNIH